MTDASMDDNTFLGSLAVFQGLAGEDLEGLQRIIERMQYRAGKVIFRQGEEGNDLFVIRDGHVSVWLREGDKTKELVRLREGSFFGEMSLFDEYPRSATVLALSDVLAYRIGGEAFRAFSLQHPRVLFQVCKVFSHRLRDTNSLLTKR